MRTTSGSYAGMVAVGIAVLLAASPVRLSGQPTAGVSVGASDLGGVVASAISSTRSDSARTCRSPPATPTSRSWPS